MRYYRIEIDGGPTYTSFANGRNLPAALTVNFDIPVAPFASPMQNGAFIKVWGISLQDIAQAKDLTGKNIKVYGGFQKGLPLANPAQAGLLVQGYIFQSFGNAIGTEQSLDLIVMPGVGPASGTNKRDPKNIVLNWKQGSSMADAVKNTLSVAYPGFTASININPKLVLLHDENGYYENVSQFAAYINATSKAIIGGDYQGVDILLTEKAFSVYDGSQTSGGTSAKTVDFKDLIGQPTWIESPSIQFKCPMRADIKVGDKVTMPKTNVTNTAQAQSSLVNQKVSFQGTFQIASVRHVGDFRQPSGDSWATVFNAFPMKTQAA